MSRHSWTLVLLTIPPELTARQCLIALAKIWFSLADALERRKPVVTKLSLVKRQHQSEAEGEETSR